MGIDAGTTGVRALVFDETGLVVGRAYRELKVDFPQPGWVEQDAGLVWSATLEVALAAVAEAGLVTSDLGAIGIANQRSSIVAWDGVSLSPLSPLIAWQDLRTQNRCTQLMAEGFYIIPMQAASKAEWILANCPAAATAAKAGHLRLGTPNSWLAACLSGGVHACDHANASTTGLYAHVETGWDETVLQALGLQRSWMPELVESNTVFATTAADVFGAEVPLASMCGDQQASLFGLGCTEVGQTKCSYGTAAMVDSNTGFSMTAAGPGTYPLVAWSFDGRPTYCSEGTVITAGAAVQWLRDGLGLIQNAAETSALAQSINDAGGVWAVPALQGAGTPIMDPSARAMLAGLTRASGKAEVVRAVLEGIANRVSDAAESLWSETESPAVLRVDGGASANDFLMQRQADLLGIAVERGREINGAALGAACMAASATGLWQGDCSGGVWQLERCFEPSIDEQQRQDERGLWAKRLQGAVALSRVAD